MIKNVDNSNSFTQCFWIRIHVWEIIQTRGQILGLEHVVNLFSILLLLQKPRRVWRFHVIVRLILENLNLCSFVLKRWFLLDLCRIYWSGFVCRGFYLEDIGMCKLSSGLDEGFALTQSITFLIISLFESGWWE